MSKYFNDISVFLSPVISVIAYYLGGVDAMLKTLIVLVILDYCTGLLKAIYNKQLDSSIGYKGIIKKILMFIVVAIAVAIENTYQIDGLRSLTITFFAVNEALSILENAGALGLPLPKQLKDALVQLRGGDNEDK